MTTRTGACACCAPQAPPRGRAWSVGVDTAEAELKLALRYGLVHESFVEEPRAA